MPVRHDRAHIDIDREALATLLDCEPFMFSHNLATLEMFRLSALQHLAARYVDRDYSVAGGLQRSESHRQSERIAREQPFEAIERLGSDDRSIVLQRPENYDRRFRELLVTVFSELMHARGGIDGKLVRLDSSISICGAALTSLACGTASGFSFQVAGTAVHAIDPVPHDERELERRALRMPASVERDDTAAREFRLAPDAGVHQPCNALGRIKTRKAIAIWYTLTFETDVMRARTRVRAFNHYFRRAGRTPAALGAAPAADGLKSALVRLAEPARRGFATLRRAAPHIA